MRCDSPEDRTPIEQMRCRIGGATIGISVPKALQETLWILQNRFSAFQTQASPDLRLILFQPKHANPGSCRRHTQDVAGYLASRIRQKESTTRRPRLLPGMPSYLERILSDAFLDEWMKNACHQNTFPAVVPLQMGCLLYDPTLCEALLIVDMDWPQETFGRRKPECPNLPYVTVINGVCALLSLYLADCRGVLVHGTGVAHDREGFLFVAPSGGGKTTLASQFGPGTVLADDGVIVRETGGRYLLYPTPFRQRPGGSPYDWQWHEAPVPLRGLFILEKGGVTSLAPISRARALTMLVNAFTHFFFRMNVHQSVDTFDFWRCLTKKIPACKLIFRAGDDIRPVLRDG